MRSTCRQRNGLLSHDSACAGIHEQARTRPRRHDHDKSCRPADEQRPGRIGLSHKRSAKRRHESACDRVREDRGSRQRRVTGNNQDADAPAGSASSVGGAPSDGPDGDVSDVVDAVLYLDGAQFVTGEILHVDGGQAAGHHMVQGA